MKIYLAGPDEYSFKEFINAHKRERVIFALFSYFDLREDNKTARDMPFKELLSPDIDKR